MRQLSSQNNISHHLRLFPYVATKCTTVLSRMLVSWAFAILTSSKHANAHTGCKEPERDHRISLDMDREINSLSSE
jgi:hypothetical protein